MRILLTEKMHFVFLLLWALQIAISYFLYKDFGYINTVGWQWDPASLKWQATPYYFLGCTSGYFLLKLAKRKTSALLSTAHVFLALAYILWDELAYVHGGVFLILLLTMIVVFFLNVFVPLLKRDRFVPRGNP